MPSPRSDTDLATGVPVLVLVLMLILMLMALVPRLLMALSMPLLMAESGKSSPSRWPIRSEKGAR